MVKVLIVDQFSGPTPYAVSKNPTPFEELAARVQADFEERNSRATANGGLPLFGRPEVKEVGDDFRPPMCTTVIRPNAQGIAEVWRTKWDSSG